MTLVAKDVDAATPPAGHRAGFTRFRRLGAPLAIATFGAACYAPGLNWGLPATRSWSQDTIAGLRTLGALESWPAAWRGRYPPLQYLLLGAAYQPILRSWDRSGVRVVDPQTGQAALTEPHAPKIGRLLLVARVISALMAVATGWGIWATARLLTGDDLAALLAALTFMSGAEFTYFAHLGNVDVPSMCWIAWSLFFFARLLRSHRWTDALYLGLFGSLAASTKDSAAGLYPGMAVVLLAEELRRHRQTMSSGKAVARAILQAKWLAGTMAFVLPYLLLYGAWSDPAAYLERMSYWLNPPAGSLHAGQLRYPDPWGLMLATVRYAAGAVGWPMLVTMAASAGWALFRQCRLAVILLVPAVGYCLIVLLPIGFVYARFLFPPLALLSMLVGLAGAAFWREAAWPRSFRYAVLGAVLLPTLAYAAAVNAEMITDSRYDAEAWFRENVPPSASVGAFSDPQYLPRLEPLGYRSYRVEMTRESFDRPQPDYLLLTSYHYVDFDERQRDCMASLMRGELGYEPVVEFHGRFLGTGSSWLSLAGWGAPVPGKISPTLTVLQRREPGSLAAPRGPARP